MSGFSSNQFSIATWNVNSLRVRLPHLLEWLTFHQPDIFAIQETKVEDINFPLAEITAAGYQVLYYGQKSYNGVAILSRLPLTKIENDIPLLKEQCRVLVGTVADLCVVNLYVPNGASVGSEKFTYKLTWLQRVTELLRDLLQQYPRMVVLGDFNIAPNDNDVYDPSAWEGQVLCSPPERQALKTLLDLGFHDTFRLFETEAGHYTWWDYRMGAFRRNHGLRIDHILISKALRNSCQTCEIDKKPRSLERPSDHTPVIAKFCFVP